MVKRIVTVIVAGLLLFGASASLAAETYSIDPTHSSVVFKVRHLVSKVSGRFDKFQGAISIDQENLTASSVEFTIDATSIDTDNENRDRHLKSEDFFAVEQFPVMTFKSSKIAKTGEAMFDVTGDFTMHGVTKTITIPVELLGLGMGMRGTPVAGFESSFKLNRKDYGIEWNRTLDAGGVVLGDMVEVNITIEAGVKADK